MRYAGGVAGALAVAFLLGAAAQDAPKSIKEVMVAHKGKDSLLEKIKGGKGTDDDAKKLVSFYEALVTFKAPQGDEKSWKDKTEALLAASKEVAEKKAGAADKLKTASDCKACHSVHRPAK
jgi:hypothetical protein